MEQLDYNLLYRWFVGVKVYEPSRFGPCSPRTATEWLRPTWGAQVPGTRKTAWAGVGRTQIQGRAAMKSNTAKDGSSDSRGPGHHGECDFPDEKQCDTCPDHGPPRPGRMNLSSSLLVTQ